jgi:hypothetical protein
MLLCSVYSNSIGVMMTYFVDVIDGTAYYFLRVKHAHEVMYYVSSGSAGQLMKFKMRFKQQHWKVVTGGLPDYVYKAEQLLSAVIIENEETGDA